MLVPALLEIPALLIFQKDSGIGPMLGQRKRTGCCDYRLLSNTQGVDMWIIKVSLLPTPSPTRRPWRSTALCPLGRPQPHGTAAQGVGWAQADSCTQGVTSVERWRCYNLEREEGRQTQDGAVGVRR